MARPIPTFEGLKGEYTRLWNTMQIDPGQAEKVTAAARRILASKARYAKVAEFTKVPWWWIGITHNMEAGGNFSRHLHNGDPLTARTRQVPANRPVAGNPPFSWEESAVDALQMKGLHLIKDWSLERAAYEWERYNGWGYRQYHPEDLSPYLWSKTNHNDGTGKYVADGKWDARAFSEAQCGTMPTLRRLMELDRSISFGRPNNVRDAVVGGTIAAGGTAAASEAGLSTGGQIAVGVVLAAAIIGVVLFLRRRK